MARLLLLIPALLALLPTPVAAVEIPGLDRAVSDESRWPFQADASPVASIEASLEGTASERLETLAARLDALVTEAAATPDPAARRLAALGRRQLDAVQPAFEDDPATAVAALRTLEAAEPGQPETASNLARALELSGDRAEARTWAIVALSRRGDEAIGPDWLLPEILRWQIAGREGRLIELPDNWDGQSGLALDEVERSASELAEALVLELDRRVPLADDDDPITGELIYTLARLVARTARPAEALELLDLAVAHGLDDGPAEAASRAAWAPPGEDRVELPRGRSVPARFLPPAAGALLLGALIAFVLALRLGRRRKAAATE